MHSVVVSGEIPERVFWLGLFFSPACCCPTESEECILFMKPVAKDCVACGSPARLVLRGRVECRNPACQMLGPKNDRDASKWNALPRRQQGRAARKTPPWQRKDKSEVAKSESKNVKARDDQNRGPDSGGE